MATSVRGLFGGGRRDAGRGPRRLRQRPPERARFEALESRKLLAITGLPATVGNLAGAPIVLATDGLGPNTLSITLQDQTIGGISYAVATITANTTKGTVTNSYWNYNSSISFAGTFDTAGGVANDVSLTTPFGFDLSKGTTAYDWNTVSSFAPRGLPNVSLKLTNADSLAVTTTPGSALASTVAGTFTSPTLTPGAGAAISLNSNGPVTVLAAGVSTYDFTYTGTKNGTPFSPLLTLQGGITASNNITLTDAHDISIDQPLKAGGTITITTAGGAAPAGVITVNKPLTAGGAITVTSAQALTTNDVITSTAAGVGLASGNGNVLTVNQDVTATNGALTLTGDGGIVTNAAADLLAVTGAVNLTSAQGAVAAAGSLTATANTVTVNATKLAATTAVVTALTGFTMTAGTDATINGRTAVTGAGNVQITATNGNLAVLPSSPITVTNGTIDLQAVAGTVSVQGQVVGNLAITVQAAQGVVLSNAVDTKAEVRATGATGSVTITTTANQVFVDAPVTSQADAVTIKSTNNDIDIRDDVSALLGVTITGNTGVTANGVAPASITLTSQTGTIAVTSTANGVTVGPNVVVVAGPGATAGVSLTAQTVVDLRVPVTAQGDISITSPDWFVVQKALTSNLGTVTITSAGGPVTAAAAPITASGTIQITGKDSVSVDTTLTSTTAGITLGSTGGFVSLGTSSNLVATDVIAGVISITAAGAFAMGSALSAGNNIGVTAGASFAPTKSFTSAAGSITISVTTGDLDVTGTTITALSPAGSVSLSAAGDLKMDASKITVGVASGSLSATAGGGLTLVPAANPITVGGSLTLSSVDPKVGFAPPLGADLFAKTGSITLAFGGTIDVSNITVQAPLGSISLTSTTGNVVVGTKAFVVETAAVGKITLAATNGTVSLGQALTAGSDIAISSLNSFTLGKNLASTTGSVAITSTGGNVDVSGATISAPAGSITLSAPTGKVNLGTNAYTAGTGFSASSNSTLTVSAPITTVGGGITLQSRAGDVALTGTANLTAVAGTITLFADGEINNGTVNGAVSKTFVQANTLVATAQGGNGVGPAPIFAFTNQQNNVDQLDILLQTGALVPIGAGVTYVDFDNLTVNQLVNATGKVSITVGGSLTVNSAIGAAPATLSGITLQADGSVIVNGSLDTVAGNIAVKGTNDFVTITGPVTAANGTVTITSGGGITGLTVNGAINALGGDVTLTGDVSVTVNGAVTSTGNVTASSKNGSVTINGAAVNAGVMNDVDVTAGLDATITGTIFAGRDVSVEVTRNITLGGATIGAGHDVSVKSTGGVGNITVAAATVNAGNSIVITTMLPGTGTVTFNGGSLKAPKPYTAGGTMGLIQIVGFNVAVPGVPTIEGGRLELRSLGVAPIVLTGTNSVDSLGVSAGGSFTFTNFSKLLEITNFDPTTAVTEVSTGGNLTITQNMLAGDGGAFRVVDGISCGGVLSLSANLSALGVQFVTTTGADNPGGPFAGTLRDMLGYINANTATNGTTNATMSAVFDEAGALVTTVLPITALPTIAKRILFDGTLAAGGNVGIGGAAVPTTSNGLTFVTGSGGSTIQDVAIHNFKGAGLELQSGDNTVSNVRSGFDRAGNGAGNGVGIRLTGTGAARNVIGTTLVGNEIGNNTGAGLVIQGGATYTSVYSNFIGVKADGTGAPNGGDGIQIVAGKGNIIGPLTGAGANTISGNRGNGVSMLNVLGTSTDYGTRLYNNTISGNTLVGVAIQGGGYNQVGTVTAPNTISNNTAGGLSITRASGGNLVSGNTVSLNGGDGVLVDTGFATRIDNNTVSGNTTAGVRLRNAGVTKTQATNRVYSNTVQGNGGNQSDGGIVIQASSGQVVGVDGAGNAAGNVVKLNAGSGIVILNGGGTQVPQSNTIANNAVLQNRFDGIRVDGSLGNLVQANTATANAGSGISVVNAFAANPKDPRFARGNVVVANTSSLNNAGIRVQGSSTNTVVGGTLVSLGNRIFSNVNAGISVESLPGAVPTGTLIQNNQVGVDSANAPAGNGGDGISLTGAVDSVVNYANSSRNNTGNGLSIVGGIGNIIGSAVKGRANTFANNQANGIFIDQPTGSATTTRMTISGNLIDQNGSNGIAVSGARTSNVTIGRAPSIAVPTGDENTISNNGGDGILVTAANNVTMIGNQFTGLPAGGLPIRLAGGANGGILAPTIVSATPRSVSGKPTWDVTGTVSGTKGQRFYVDIYDANTLFLGRVLATVGANGKGTFRVVVGGNVRAVGPLRLTATLANSGLFGGTSQFKP